MPPLRRQTRTHPESSAPCRFYADLARQRLVVVADCRPTVALELAAFSLLLCVVVEAGSVGSGGIMSLWPILMSSLVRLLRSFISGYLFAFALP